MTKKYRYTGTVETNLIGYGVVQPEQVIEVHFEIYHPYFKPEVEKEIEKKKK